MAIYLALYINETFGTIDLSDYVEDYPIRANAPDVEFVDESITITVEDTLANVQTLIHSINNAIGRAIEWNTYRTGGRVYLEKSYNYGVDTQYHSEIINGYYIPDPQTLDEGVKNNIYTFDISITRRNHWDSTSALGIDPTGYTVEQVYNCCNHTAKTAQVIDSTPNGVKTVFSGTMTDKPVRNLHFHATADDDTAITALVDDDGYITGTYVKAGATSVVNTVTGVWAIEFTHALKNATNITADYDFGYYNFVTIAAAAVLGDLPTPAQIFLTNTHASDDTRYVWVSNEHSLNAGSFEGVLEGESATGMTSQAVAAGLCSGDAYGLYTIPADTNQHDAGVWALSTSQVGYCRGQTYHVLARFYPPAVATPPHPTKCWFQLQIRSGTNVLKTYGKINPKDTGTSNSFYDFGTIRIPPWDVFDQDEAPALNLALMVQAMDTATSYLVELDYLLLLPTDSFGFYELLNEYADQNDRVVLDGYDQKAYIDSGPSNTPHIHNIEGAEQQIMLYPGRVNVLRFAFQDADKHTPPTWVHSLAITYHARNLAM